MGSFKRQFHEIFDHFFGLKNSTWAPYDRQKWFRDIFRFRGDIRSQSSKNLLSKKQIGQKSRDIVPCKLFLFVIG